ncbi:MAG: hypothetical protein ACI3ZF_02395 [Candidatus Cryptobacteroides sp.]
MNKRALTALLISSICCMACKSDNYAGLTLVPYGTVTDQIALDIRAGFINKSKAQTSFDVEIWLDDQTLLEKNNFILGGGTIITA